jgi:hypothetical protein
MLGKVGFIPHDLPQYGPFFDTGSLPAIPLPQQHAHDEEIMGFALPILHMVDQASRDKETGTPCSIDRIVLGLLDEFED